MSIRKKVDKYFDNSQTSKMKASRELDYEGMMDDYMESMFKPTGTKIEMGSRSIKPIADDAPLLKGKAYQDAKKVSRDDLNRRAISSSSESDEYSDQEFGEDEMSESIQEREISS